MSPSSDSRLHAASRDDLQVIAVVGMSRGAGVTTIGVGLAETFALDERVVVLVDGNIGAPRLHSVFDIPLEPGLASIFAGTGTIDEARWRSPDGTIDVLPAGKWADPATAYSPQRWVGLFRDLRASGAIILVDGGTVASPWAAAIGTASDAVAFVVESGRTQWEQVEAASEQWSRLDTKLLGVIVNK